MKIEESPYMVRFTAEGRRAMCVDMALDSDGDLGFEVETDSCCCSGDAVAYLDREGRDRLRKLLEAVDNADAAGTLG